MKYVSKESRITRVSIWEKAHLATSLGTFTLWIQFMCRSLTRLIAKDERKRWKKRFTLDLIIMKTEFVNNFWACYRQIFILFNWAKAWLKTNCLILAGFEKHRQQGSEQCVIFFNRLRQWESGTRYESFVELNTW